jgi:hypothetical protein
VLSKGEKKIVINAELFFSTASGVDEKPFGEKRSESGNAFSSGFEGKLKIGSEKKKNSSMDWL